MLRENKGFTLIELMVVLAIAAIMAALAVGVAANTAPRSRVVGLAHSVRSALAEARMRAVRTGRMHKVCLFSDSLPGAAPSFGRVLVLGCNGRGSDCTLATICADVIDSTAMNADATTKLYDDSMFTAPTVVDRTCTATLTTKWCPISEDAFQVSRSEGASIASFGSGGNKLEVTYGPNGLVLIGGSTSPATSVRLVNAAHCTSNCATGAATFSSVVDLSYALGGPVRMN